jgi:hypothetical protein
MSLIGHAPRDMVICALRRTAILEIILFADGRLPQNILLRFVFALTSHTRATTKKDESINFLSKRFTPGARLRYCAVMSDHGSGFLDRILNSNFHIPFEHCCNAALCHWLNITSRLCAQL